ncbi:MAG: AAA family ATPase [Candidatus Woesearchaeota archaeon]
MQKIKLPRKTLVFVAGGPATGKTTVLEQIVPQIEGVLLVDKDDISDTFLRTPKKEGQGEYNVRWYRLDGEVRLISSEHYRENVGQQTYRAMLEIAKTNLRLGLTPLLQGNYTSQMAEGYFQEVVEPFFEEANLVPRTKILFCFADKETIAERIRRRNAQRDTAKLSSPEALQRYLDSQDFLPNALEKLDHVKLNSSTSSVVENVDRAISYLMGEMGP